MDGCPDAALIAPFAEWPSQFDVAGRCTRCDEFGWLAFLVVWPRNRDPRTNGPDVYYGSGAFCEQCMVDMGVGGDDSRPPVLAAEGR